MSGKLFVTGIGPGHLAGMTGEAVEALQQCDVVVGYKTYNALVRPHFPDKIYLETPMTGEEARCEMALQEASRGRTTALICSGDPGVYGMAGLVLKMAVHYPDVEVRVISGVTAAMSGAALLGAPLIHDFAVISLSDRLTPWETIRRRLLCAAEADLGIVLYNPASKGRSGHLGRAAEILMTVLPGSRICGIAERIGREGERTRIMSLSELAGAEADMFCTVFVGNRSAEYLDGKIVTPRGYRYECVQQDSGTASNTGAEKAAMTHKPPVLIFAGTTEGRELAIKLAQAGVNCLVSVATEYGAALLPETEGIRVLQGRLDAGGMVEVIRRNGCTCVADATHPFAVEVSKEIRKACAETGAVYYRLRRNTEDNGEHAAAEPGGDLRSAQTLNGQEPSQNVMYVRTVAEAAQILRDVSGNIFLTTGSKDLKERVDGIGSPERIYARVLPSVQSLTLCEESGLPASHIIAMQGPFSRQINEAMLRETHAAAMLTKESGRTGGYFEKLQAAQAVGIPVVVIRNPEQADSGSAAGSQGMSITAGSHPLQEVFQSIIERVSGIPSSRVQITLAGMGPGGPDYILPTAREALQGAQIVFGAPTVIERARAAGVLPAETKCVAEYKAEKVLSFLLQVSSEFNDGTTAAGMPAPECRAVVLFSGDTGCFSGAASYAEAVRKLSNDGQNSVDLRILPGISSVSALAARLGVPVNGAQILSRHGRDCNLVGHLVRNRAVFLLVAGVRGLHRAVEELQEAIQCGVLPSETAEQIQCGVLPGEAADQMDGSGVLRVGFGYQLTMADEEAGFCTLTELAQRGKEGLYLLYLENPAAAQYAVTPGLADEAFERIAAPGPETGAAAIAGRPKPVPMTKEEVRVISLSRLRLTPNAVLWDIGAGTGSVSIEAARLCPDGTVCAIEKRPEAAELIRKNIRRFGVSNVQVVEADAPDGLEDAAGSLPDPTHVFVGGSGGRLAQILKSALSRNPRVRIVINCIALETLSETLRILQELPVTAPSIRQVWAARAKEAGGLHLMQAQNPVYIIDLEGTD